MQFGGLGARWRLEPRSSKVRDDAVEVRGDHGGSTCVAGHSCQVHRARVAKDCLDEDAASTSDGGGGPARVPAPTLIENKECASTQGERLRKPWQRFPADQGTTASAQAPRANWSPSCSLTHSNPALSPAQGSRDLGPLLLLFDPGRGAVQQHHLPSAAPSAAHTRAAIGRASDERKAKGRLRTLLWDLCSNRCVMMSSNRKGGGCVQQRERRELGAVGRHFLCGAVWREPVRLFESTRTRNWLGTNPSWFCL